MAELLRRYKEVQRRVDPYLERYISIMDTELDYTLPTLAVILNLIENYVTFTI